MYKILGKDRKRTLSAHQRPPFLDGDLNKLRTILACLFASLILLLFIWSVKKDFQLKELTYIFGLPGGMIHYTVQLKSFNPEDQTFNGTLTVDPELLPPEMYLEPMKIHYGPLFYENLTVPYALGMPSISPKLLYLRPFQKVKPPSKEISLQAIGNPEIYPFDKYFIMCTVKCHAYFKEGIAKNYFENQDHGEALSIINSINGLFIRTPTKKELDQIKASFNLTKGPIRQINNKDLKEMNNRKDTFALMIVRPYYLRFMTVVLGVFALAAAVYIGFVLPLKDRAISIPGFVIVVWGIRSILLSDTKIFLAYFDYTVLFLYLLLFVAITCRLISGKKKQSR